MHSAGQAVQPFVEDRRVHSKHLLCGRIEHQVHACEPVVVDITHGMRHRAALVKARRKCVDECRSSEASGDKREVKRDTVHARAGHHATQCSVQCLAKASDAPVVCCSGLSLRHGRHC